jgi:Uma2 family endonuclease
MAIDTRCVGFKLVREADGVVIDLSPIQGIWTEEQYLKITDRINHVVEFTDGIIEVVPMPTEHHQAILELLFFLFRAFIEELGGKVRFAPLRVLIRNGKFREPDILLVCDANDPRRQNRYWLGADLVVEVVSSDDPERDTVEKVLDYAEAGIPEYWIVNPEEERISVLTLQGGAYATHGVFARGETARSLLLEGFSVDVAAVMDAS